jgi:hypothetical protein
MTSGEEPTDLCGRDRLAQRRAGQDRSMRTRSVRPQKKRRNSRQRGWMRLGHRRAPMVNPVQVALYAPRPISGTSAVSFSYTLNLQDELGDAPSEAAQPSTRGGPHRAEHMERAAKTPTCLRNNEANRVLTDPSHPPEQADLAPPTSAQEVDTLSCLHLARPRPHLKNVEPGNEARVSYSTSIPSSTGSEHPFEKPRDTRIQASSRRDDPASDPTCRGSLVFLPIRIGRAATTH